MSDQATIHDLSEFIAQPRITGLTVSRTAQTNCVVASVAHLAADADRYVTRLVGVDPEGGPASRLTRSKSGESISAIGPRGEIYFTSERADDESKDEDVQALWMLPPHGEARVVLRRAGGVNAVHATSQGLIVEAPCLPNVRTEDDHAAMTKERREKAVSAILYEDFPTRSWDHDLGPAENRVYTAELPDLEDGEIELRPIEIPDGRIDGVLASDDGSVILANVTRRLQPTVPVVSVFRLSTNSGPEPLLLGAVPEDVPIEYVTESISPDGSKATVSVETGNRDGHPLTSWIEVVDLATGSHTRPVPSFSDWVTETAWVDESTLLISAPRRGRQSLYLLDLEADEIRLLTDDDSAYHDIGVLDGDTAVGLRSSIAEPSAVVRIDLGTGQVRELAELVSPVSVAGTLAEVTARGQDGTEVRAWLARPEGNGPHPLLTFVHGGPWGSWNDWTWRWNPWPFVSRGYAVLLPDPAISIGYGQEMLDRGNDAIGDVPYTDILALIDAAAELDEIDTSRSALLGGSYGGYMANWMAGHTDTRFSCIVSHASLWNIDAMGRTTDNGDWHEWTTASQEAEYSPHRFADQIRVPMLVTHGDRDYRVPISQSMMLWHALQRESPATGHRYLYFPDENHWILKPSNSQVWYETVLAFLGHHVLGEEWVRPALLG